MLTDDDLTTELRAAFRGATDDVTYAGRTRPRRATAVALPLVAASVTAGAIVLAAHPWNQSPAPATAVTGPAHAGSPSTAPSQAAGGLVEQRISLAGFTLTYERRAGDADPLHAEMRAGKVPAGFRPVPLTGTEARAWVGRDPRTGENALFVKAPTRNGGRTFALLSSRWSQRELVDLLRTGEPRTVPLTRG